jgi:hypothetical protein
MQQLSFSSRESDHAARSRKRGPGPAIHNLKDSAMFKRVSKPVSTGNRLLLLLASVVAISAALIGGSGSAQAESQDRLPELIKITGADAGFDSLAEETKQSIRKEVSQDPKLANNLSAMEAAIDTALAPDILKSTFLQSFTGRLTAVDIDALIDFYNTPLGYAHGRNGKLGKCS